MAELETHEVIIYGFIGLVVALMAVFIAIAVVHVARHGMPKSGGGGAPSAPPMGEVGPSNADAGGD